MSDNFESSGGLGADLELKSVLYFNACKNARFEKTQRIFQLPWRLRALWYQWLALQFSNQFVRLVGLANMQVDQLRLRSDILFGAHRFQAALDCLDEALSKNVTVAEKAACEIDKGNILEAMGRRKEAYWYYFNVWQIRHQLSDNDVEDLISSLSTHFAKVGNPAKSLEIFKEGENLVRWRESVRN